MDIISDKSTDPIELEKLCLLQPKITEIEDLFKMTEKDYRKLIDLLFVNHNFLTEIDKWLAYNYPIITQDCMLSLTEKNSSKDSNSSSTQQNSELVRIIKKISINEEQVDGEGEIQVKSLKTGEVVTLTENDEEEKVEVDSGKDLDKKCISSSSKPDNCTLLSSNKCIKSPSLINKCTSSNSKKCTTSPSISKKCIASPSKSNKCTVSPQCDKTSTTQSDEKKYQIIWSHQRMMLMNI